MHIQVVCSSTRKCRLSNRQCCISMYSIASKYHIISCLVTKEEQRRGSPFCILVYIIYSTYFLLAVSTGTSMNLFIPLHFPVHGGGCWEHITWSNPFSQRLFSIYLSSNVLSLLVVNMCLFKCLHIVINSGIPFLASPSSQTLW